MSHKYDDAIKLISLGLAQGDTSYDFACPACKEDGGNFSVTRQSEGILYHCFRAKCGIRGFVSTNNVVYTIPKITKPKLFEHDIVTLPEDVHLYMLDKFPAVLSQDLVHNEVSWSDDLKRVIFPLKDSRGYIWGYNARYYTDCAACTKTDGPKSLMYKQTPGCPTGAWYGRSAGMLKRKKVILVEDCVSAIVLGNHYTTISCMGHNIDERLLAMLKDFVVVLIFDSDVLTKTFEQYKKYGLFVKSMHVIDPVKDPKDMSFVELENLLKIVDGT